MTLRKKRTAVLLAGILISCIVAACANTKKTKENAENVVTQEEKSDTENPAVQEEKSDTETPAVQEEKSDTETPVVQEEKSDTETSAALSSEEVKTLFSSCMGYEGTAGSSLKSALAAYEALKFAIDHKLADLEEKEPGALKQAMLEALESFMPEEKEELDRNLTGAIFSMTDSALENYDTVRDNFADAGAEDMEALAATDRASQHWAVLKEQYQALGTGGE